jgi:hypothetical protein
VRDLSTWFERRSRREARIVRLEEALLSNRFLAYAVHRLRYFFLRYLVVSCLHAAKFFVLYNIFARDQIHAILVVWVGAGLASGFWWGGLEVMRGRIRQLNRSGQPHRIAAEVAGWLSLSRGLSIAVVVFGVGWVAWRLRDPVHSLGAGDLYIVAVYLSLACELVTRCYHSGVYAIQRIFRPMRTIVCVDIVWFATALAMWPLIGAWSFPVASIVATLLMTTLIIVYTRRSYRLLGISPANLLRWLPARRPQAARWREFVAGGLANVAMTMDSLLLFVLLGPSPAARSGWLLLLLFAVSPSIKAGFKWAQLFYFDLKRLEPRLFNALRRRFERQVMRLTIPVGLVFWAAASLIATAINRRYLGEAYLLLLPFFVFRAVLAAQQVAAFAERAYAKVLASGLACAAGFLLVNLEAGNQRTEILGLAAVALAAAVFLVLVRRAPVVERIAAGEVLPFSGWLSQVNQVRGPVRINAVRIRAARARPRPGSDASWGEKNRWGQRELARELARRLGDGGAATWINPGRIAWYELGGLPRVDPEWLIIRGGGLLEPISDSGIQAGGRAALGACQHWDLLKDVLVEPLSRQHEPVAVGPLKAQFQHLFPKGIVYAPDEPAATRLRRMSSRRQRTVLRDASSFAKDFRLAPSRRRFEVTALCIAGEMRLIFLTDRRASPVFRSHWLAHVKSLNLQAAVSPASD